MFIVGIALQLLDGRCNILTGLQLKKHAMLSLKHLATTLVIRDGEDCKDESPTRYTSGVQLPPVPGVTARYILNAGVGSQFRNQHEVIGSLLHRPLCT